MCESVSVAVSAHVCVRVAGLVGREAEGVRLNETDCVSASDIVCVWGAESVFGTGSDSDSDPVNGCVAVSINGVRVLCSARVRVSETVSVTTVSVTNTNVCVAVCDRGGRRVSVSVGVFVSTQLG